MKHVSPTSSSSSAGVSRSPRTPFKKTRLLSPFSRSRARSLEERESFGTTVGVAALVLIIAAGAWYTFDLCSFDASKQLRAQLILNNSHTSKATATGDTSAEPSSTSTPSSKSRKGTAAATATQSVASFYAEAGNFRCPHSQRYAKAEVARHATEDDLWIVVDGNVLDVSGFVRQHPGGAMLLDGAGGHEMATVFARFHDPTSVQLFASFCIGQLRR